MEGDEGLEAHGGFFILELLERAEGGGIYVELEHVEDFVGVGADKGETVGAFLGVKAEDEERGIVLEGEKLES